MGHAKAVWDNKTMVPLERSSLEAYGFGLITIASVVIPMTSWLRVILGLIGIGLLIDIIWRSKWTISLRTHHKAILSSTVIAVIVVVTWVFLRQTAESKPVDQTKSSKIQAPTPSVSESSNKKDSRPTPIHVEGSQKTSPAKRVTSGSGLVAIPPPKPQVASQPQPAPSQPGSISQTNSGGINVQQGTTGNNSPIIDSPINIGDIPRSISTQDMAALAAFFRSAKSKSSISIRADQVSGLAPFPDKFYQALKDGGWTMIEEGVNHYMGFAPPGPRFQGAVVYINGAPLAPNETVYFNENDPMLYIGKALEALKIPRLLRREQSLPEVQISINFEGGFPH